MGNSAFIRQAIDKCCLTATYRGKTRHFSPYGIGLGDDGGSNVIPYQYASERSAPLPEWRCFKVSRLANVVRNRDEWQTAPEHAAANACVTQIDVQAH